ncbi:ABC transporter permease [Bordetella genomosp. 1]|uniref:ABC transporter permease n=1 Tax=Bordetella genomosp. 1 TaxID=1395607 RepID=A0A261SS63_9BORD|nr:ABC transporter permease [Bordetella genomosp. 1]MDQ8033909.1 ABC transporter permease [Bordetella sp.]OZI40226.1 ABC transporter permease [Bordetella genomosp. 1]OZI68422.1 ABC transporter permease [Bordetella genomosp. 1]
MTSFFASFCRNKGGIIGLAVLAAVCLLALVAGWVFPGSPWDIANGPFMPPLTEGAPLGTDMLGRDIASGIAYGARVTLLLAGVSTAVSIIFGISMGAAAGFYGGKVDQAVVGFIELFQTIPSFFLAVVLVAILTPSMGTVILAIAVVSWPPLARLVRAEFMSLKNREFVQAAVLSGQSNLRIILTQILPNSLSPVIVSGSLMIASAILLESALSFLGLGDPNSMTWGYIIGASRSVLRDAWWMSVFPGVAILATVLALNLIGEALNDALNPKLARKRST